MKITAKVAADGNVELDGTTVVVSGLSGEQARMAGSLVIDPGAVVKLSGTRIEVGMGAQLIAEGTAAYPIIFTSMMDDTYGAGGTFDTTNNKSAVTASPGDWGGLYFSPTSRGSLDYARVFYAGGNVAIEGGFASFAPIDIRQATVRIADSLFQYNTRHGRRRSKRPRHDPRRRRHLRPLRAAGDRQQRLPRQPGGSDLDRRQLAQRAERPRLGTQHRRRQAPSTNTPATSARSSAAID